MTARGSAQRINSNSYTEAYTTDNNFETAWIAKIDEPEVNITVSLVEGTAAAYQVTLYHYSNVEYYFIAYLCVHSISCTSTQSCCIREIH